MTDDERFIEWWCSPNASSARLTPQDEPGACAGFAAGLAAGRAEVQKRIEESPVGELHEIGLAGERDRKYLASFWLDARGLRGVGNCVHLVPVEPKEETK